MTLDDMNAALAAEGARSRAVRLRLLRAKLDQQALAFDLVGAAETERAIMRLEEEPRRSRRLDCDKCGGVPSDDGEACDLCGQR